MSYHLIGKNELNYNLLLDSDFALNIEVDEFVNDYVIKGRDNAVCRYYKELIDEFIQLVMNVLPEYEDGKAIIQKCERTGRPKVPHSIRELCKLGIKIFHYTCYTPIILSNETLQEKIFHLGRFFDEELTLYYCYETLLNDAKYFKELYENGDICFEAELVEKVPEKFRENV